MPSKGIKKSDWEQFSQTFLSLKGAVKKVPQEAGCAGRYSLQNIHRKTADSGSGFSRFVVS